MDTENKIFTKEDLALKIKVFKDYLNQSKENIAMLEDTNFATMEALAEAYEHTLKVQEDNLIAMEAITEIYEMMLPTEEIVEEATEEIVEQPVEEPAVTE